MVGVETALAALLSDPSFGIPLLLAVALTAALAWWSWVRTAEPPPMLPGAAPEYWRIQVDSRAYFTLGRGEYLVAVDALGRQLGSVVMDKFHVKIGRRAELDAPAVDRALPAPMTLRALVGELSRAYYSAFWAEQPGWLAARWPWLQRRNQRRAARDFRRITDALSRAMPALEAA
jgi:hypothetical protein